MKRNLAMAIAAAAIAAFPAGAQTGAQAQQGYGPGMMGGYGMGPGMMGGYGMGPGALAGLDLSAEQRSRIRDIQREVRQQHWTLMGQVHEQQFRLQELQESGTATREQIDQAYAAAAEAHKKMLDTARDARSRMQAVLTPEQREKLGRLWDGPRGPG